MPKNIRYTLLSLRDLLVSAGPVIVIAGLLLWLAFWWLDPMPPRRITLATGRTLDYDVGAAFLPVPAAGPTCGSSAERPEGS